MKEGKNEYAHVWEALTFVNTRVTAILRLDSRWW